MWILGIELRSSHLLGKCFGTELHPQHKLHTAKYILMEFQILQDIRKEIYLKKKKRWKGTILTSNEKKIIIKNPEVKMGTVGHTYHPSTQESGEGRYREFKANPYSETLCKVPSSPDFWGKRSQFTICV